jgi:drug/metabolite transporter (DMT)-like permease
VSEAAFPVEPARHRRPRLGYLMAAVAAALWGLNGGVSKTILATGLSSERLAQVRSLGAAAGLVAILAVTAPNRLRLTRRELPYLVAFGMGGLAFVQFFYFLAIHRLEIGIALLVEYLAPLLVALWSRFVQHAPVRRRIWVALGLALTGLGLIVDVFGGGKSLSTAGLAFALGGAFAYALYVLLAEHVVGGRDAVSLLAWGSALRHVSATTAGIVAMLEPVVGAIVGWLWLNESLDAVQLVGAAIVLIAISLAQSAR